MYHKWLRSFHAVAKEGGFTAASNVLNIGQSTITSQVKALERHFGVELFHRTRPITLTGTGQILIEITQEIFGHEEEAIAFLNGQREFKRGQIKIGGVGAPVVMELVQNYQKSYPNIQLDVCMAPGEEVLKSLINFETDIAVIAHVTDDTGFFYLPFVRSNVVLFVNVDHPWAGRDHVSIEELEGQKFILQEKTSSSRQALEQATANARVQFGSTIEINSYEAVMSGIIRGPGIGTVSELEYVPHERLRVIRITDVDVFVSFYVVCLSNRRKQPLVQAFLKTAEYIVENRLSPTE